MGRLCFKTTHPPTHIVLRMTGSAWGTLLCPAVRGSGGQVAQSVKGNTKSKMGSWGDDGTRTQDATSGKIGSWEDTEVSRQDAASNKRKRMKEI